ncbi:MAG: hypothetical protein ACFFDX_12930 [Candidatus Odinarchaeota archaeon]
MTAWKAIAKTELRRKTSGFRKHRLLLFIVIYTILCIWAFIIAPLIFDLFMPTLATSFPGTIFSIVGYLIEFILMMLFLLIIMYPMQNIYRKTEVGYKEMVLASPVRPGDIFIGEFMGKVPIYLIFILAIAPIITGLINPIINLNIVHYIVIYLCVTGHIVFAALLGSILVSWLEHKIARSEKARDLGKVLLFLLAIAMVAIMYTFTYLFEYITSNPQIKNYLMVYPSLWFSNIILYTIQPILISSYILNIWASISLAVFIPLIILYITFKKAHLFFSLETSIEKATTIIEKENKFYKFIRKITRMKWKGLIITQLKEFFRKRENIMKIVYTIGLTLFEGVIFAFLIGDYPNLDIEDISMYMMMSVMIAGMLFSLFLGNYIFVGSKELIWVYKKSPRNIKALIFSYLRMTIIIIFFIGIGLTIFFSLFFQYDIFTAIFFFLFLVIYCLISVSQAIGLQCINPAFEEKGGDMQLTIGILVIINMATIFGSLFLGFQLVGNLNPPPELIKVVFSLPLITFGTLFAIPLLLFGLKKLNKME